MRLRASRTHARRCSAAVACSLFIGLCCCLPLSHGAPTVHTVVPTECGLYFTWQTLGIFYSHRKSGQAGPITRIMSCTEEQLKQYNDVDLVPTHVAPSLTQDPAHNDVYSAYNKPGAVKHWIENTDPPEDFILVIDADMIMRTPFFPDQLGAGPGWAISAFFSYMKGVNNELAEKHIPWVARRNDTIAGPYGRKGDMVGGFCLMDKNDLRRVAPLWLKYSMDVRNDPDAWNLTGDHYSIHPGDKPWISEMYGYSYGTAHAGVWHKVDYSAMIYPGDYTPSSPPKVIHYGLLYSVANTDYQYDKHWHYGFDARRCPPWGDLTQRQPRGGLFPHPPHPESLKTQGFELMRDLMAVETIITLNAAFCEHHRAHCPPSEELERECGKVADMEDALTRMFAQLAPVLANECSDRDSRCQMWADGGECLSNPGYMLKSCEKACGHCYNAAPVTTTPTAAVKLRGKGGGKRTLPDATVAAATDADGVKVEVVNPGTLPTARPGQQGAQQQQAAEIAHRDNPDVHDHSELHADQGLLQAGAVTSKPADEADSQQEAGTTPPAPSGGKGEATAADSLPEATAADSLPEDAATTAGETPGGQQTGLSFSQLHSENGSAGKTKPATQPLAGVAADKLVAKAKGAHSLGLVDTLSARSAQRQAQQGLANLQDKRQQGLAGGQDRKQQGAIELPAHKLPFLPQAHQDAGKTLHSELVSVAGIENPRATLPADSKAEVLNGAALQKGEGGAFLEGREDAPETPATGGGGGAQPKKLSDAKRLAVGGKVVIRGADLAAMKLARNLDDVKPILPEQQVSELVAGLKDKAASTLGEVLTADSYADSMPQEVTAITSRGFDQRVLPRDDLLPRAKPRPPKSTGGKPGGVAGLLSHLGWIGLGLWVFSIVAFLALLPRARRRVQRRTKSRRSL